MSIRHGIRSREGNVVVGAIGATYAIAALSVLVVHVSQTMNARSLLENAIDVVLVGAVVLGGWFITECLHAFGIIKH